MILQLYIPQSPIRINSLYCIIIYIVVCDSGKIYSSHIVYSHYSRRRMREMSRRLIVEDLVQLYYLYLYASPKAVCLQTELQMLSSGEVYTTCSITKHIDLAD